MLFNRRVCFETLKTFITQFKDSLTSWCNMVKNSKFSLISIFRIKEQTTEIQMFPTWLKDSKKQLRCISDSKKTLKSLESQNTILRFSDFHPEKWLMQFQNLLKIVWNKLRSIFLSFTTKNLVYWLRNTRKWTLF